MKRFRLNPLRALIAAEAIGIFVLLAMTVKEFIVYRYSPGAYAQPDVKAADGAVAQKDFFRYDRVVSSGLFGVDTLSLIDLTASSAAGKSAAPQTMPDIALVGTVVGRDGAGFAVFQDSRTKKQEITVVGEEVFGAGVLTRLENKKAYVMSAGRELVYEIYEKKLEGYEASSQKAASLPAVSADARPDVSKISRKTGEGQWLIDQRALNNVLSDIGKVLTDARLLPYIENGAVSGFVINEIKPDGVFGLIGLQEGDVLKKINNFEINSPEKGVQLLAGLKGESNLTVEILRNGQPVRLQYQIR